MTADAELIKSNLQFLLAEIGNQSDVLEGFPLDLQRFPEEIESIREWVEEAGEFGIAYEAMVTMLETFPFQISGAAAVKLLEVGLLMRFKTDQVQDAKFDSR